MGYLKSRLGQPTTWFGFAAAISAFIGSKYAITPDVITISLAALGLVHMNETPPPASA